MLRISAPDGEALNILEQGSWQIIPVLCDQGRAAAVTHTGPRRVRRIQICRHSQEVIEMRKHLQILVCEKLGRNHWSKRRRDKCKANKAARMECHLDHLALGSPRDTQSTLLVGLVGQRVMEMWGSVCDPLPLLLRHCCPVLLPSHNEVSSFV